MANSQLASTWSYALGHAESWLEMGGGDELLGGVMGLGGWVGLVDPILSNSLACVWPNDRVSERLKSAGVV